MRTIFLSLMLLHATTAHGAVAAPAAKGAPAGLDQILSARVRDGRVDYEGLRRDPRALDAWLDAAARVEEAAFKQWPEPERLAFLINLYNAATIRLILDRYPIASIRKIGPVWAPDKAWKLPVVRVFGRTATLNELEHEMIRPVFKEPRVHFALVCAAKGCPPLRSEAYAGASLDAQLDDQARRFLAQPEKNRADASAKTAHLSPIFKWYMADFGGSPASVLRALEKWLPVSESWSVKWTDYDWSLNEGAR